MTQTNLVQMLVARQTTDAGTAASNEAGTAKSQSGSNGRNAFAGILNDKMTSRATERSNESRSSANAATETGRENRNSARIDRDRAGTERVSAQRRDANSNEGGRKTEAATADGARDKTGQTGKTVTDRKEDGTAKAADRAEKTAEAADADVTEATEATGTEETGETETEASDGGTEMTPELAAMLQSILLDLQQVLEERVAALKQELADGTTVADALQRLADGTGDETLASQLEALLGGDAVSLVESLQETGAKGKDIRQLLAGLLGDDAGDAKLKVTVNSTPAGSNGADLLKIRMQSEGMTAKISLLEKNRPSEGSATAAVGSDVLDDAEAVEAAAVVPAESDADATGTEQQAQGQAGTFAETLSRLSGGHAAAGTNANEAASAQSIVGITQPVKAQSAEMAAAQRAERPQVLTEAQRESATSQVVDRVKLMSGESKTELEMTLKPEALGKVNLKLVEERGQILARFTAESEQVKSVLESSMQLLKDALEKNGLQVAELSVSVGQQNARGGRGETEREQTEGGGTGGTKAIGRISITERLRSLPSLGAYQLSDKAVEYLTGGESSIDLTA